MTAREQYEYRIHTIISMEEVDRAAAVAQFHAFMVSQGKVEQYHPGQRNCPFCKAVKGIYQNECPTCGYASPVPAQPVQEAASAETAAMPPENSPKISE